jgi:hypothetical protein
VTLCGSCKNQYFEKTYRLHHQGDKNQRARLVTANVIPSLLILVSLMMEVMVSLKHKFLQEPHGVTSHKTAFFIVTAMRTSNLTWREHTRFAIQQLQVSKILHCWHTEKPTNPSALNYFFKYREVNKIVTDINLCYLICRRSSMEIWNIHFFSHKKHIN